VTDADESPSPADGDAAASDSTLTRRRVLAAGGGLLGLGVAGSAYVYLELQGDDGDYVAPESFPTLSTRGTFDGDGDAQFDGEYPTPRTDDAPVADEEPAVLFVHGFQTGREEAQNQAYTAEVGFSDTERPLSTAVYSWDSDRDWGVAKSVADTNGRALAAWLADRSGPPIHVVAHSLGARVTCEALRTLRETDESTPLASVSLLGAAIPRQSVERDGRYGAAIEAAPPPVANYYSGNDRVLGWIYRFSDGTRAVGETGITDEDAAPDGYVDVDVTGAVGDHYSYYEPGEGCLPAVAERLP